MAVRARVLGPLIAQNRGHRAQGVRRIEQIAPELVPALEATVGDHTDADCVRAMRAASNLYRLLRVEASGVVRRTEAESASLEYLSQIAGGYSPTKAQEVGVESGQ